MNALIFINIEIRECSRKRYAKVDDKRVDLNGL